MIYKHTLFTLDADTKIVFDENGKELRLTGNPFRLLVFLCAKKSANLTQIGNYLDWAKDYNEDHIRQYRYKINTILGHDVLQYANGIYRLVGEIKEGNTDLLQQNEVKSGHMKKDIKFVKWPAIVAVIALLLAVLPWPYGYFTLLRFIVTAVATYYAYYLYAVLDRTKFWFWTLAFIAVLFNPIVPVYLGEKIMWSVIDIVVAIVFIGLVISITKNKKALDHTTADLGLDES